MYARESEESWAEKQRQVALLPGQEICDCGKVREVEDRHQCAHCGHVGCTACMRIADDTGNDEVNDTWVCGADCEIGWLEELAQSDERSHKLYQNWLAKQIKAVRMRKERAA